MNRASVSESDTFARQPVQEQSAVAAARRMANDLADGLGFDATDMGRAALVVTEAATNILKHAGEGEILLHAMPGATPALEVLALDNGPGLTAERLAREGQSTAGTLGMGLGAMRRMATEFEVYGEPGKGTVVRLVVAPTGQPASTGEDFEVGVVMVPHVGEVVCGDAWAVRQRHGRALFMVADGLGHGPSAHQAASTAARLLDSADEPPAQALARMHEALRAGRGAAAAVAAIDLASASVTYGGIGNIAGIVASLHDSRQLLSHSGIVGHNARRFLENPYPWPAAGTLVMHSDGLGTHWSLREYPQLQGYHPAIVAAVLYRDHSRRRDDVTVLVARERGARSRP